MSFLAKASTLSLSDVSMKRRVAALPSDNFIRLLKFVSIGAVAVMILLNGDCGAKKREVVMSIRIVANPR